MPFCGVESCPALDRGVWVTAAPPHLRLNGLERNVGALFTCDLCPVQDTTGCLLLPAAVHFTAPGVAAFLRPQVPCTGQRCLGCSSSFNSHLLAPGRNVDALFSCAFCPMTPQAAYSCLLQCSPWPRQMTFAAGTAVLLSCHCLPCTGQRCLGHGGSSTPACLPVLGRNTWAPSCFPPTGLGSSRPGVHCCMCISPNLPLELATPTEGSNGVVPAGTTQPPASMALPCMGHPSLHPRRPLALGLGRLWRTLLAPGRVWLRVLLVSLSGLLTVWTPSKGQVVLVLFKWGILTEGCLLVSPSSE